MYQLTPDIVSYIITVCSGRLSFNFFVWQWKIQKKIYKRNCSEIIVIGCDHPRVLVKDFNEKQTKKRKTWCWRSCARRQHFGWVTNLFFLFHYWNVEMSHSIFQFIHTKSVCKILYWYVMSSNRGFKSSCRW